MDSRHTAGQRAAFVLLFALMTALVLSLDSLNVIGLMVVTIGATAALARFDQVLLLLVALRPSVDLLRHTGLGVGGLSMMQLFSGAVAGVVCVRLLLDLPQLERRPLARQAVLWCLVAGGIGGASLSAGSMGAMLKMLLPGLLWLAVTRMRLDRAAVERWLGVFSLGYATPVLALGLAYARGERTELDGIPRLCGPYGIDGVHDGAYAMTLAVLLAVWWVLRPGPWWRRLTAAASGTVCLVLLYETYVRTAQIGLVIGIVLLLVLERRLALLGVAVVAFAVLIASSEVLQERFVDLMRVAAGSQREGELEDVGSGRLVIWQVSVSRWLEQGPKALVFGVGLDNHYALSPSGHHDTHNDYLGLLIQLGPLAPLAYLWLQASAVRWLWSGRQQADEGQARVLHLALALHAVGVVTSTLSNAFVRRQLPSWHLWVLTALAISMIAHSSIGRRRSLPLAA